MISLKNISKTLNGEDYIVNDVSLDVLEGELLVILGSSGAGKSSLLKMMSPFVRDKKIHPRHKRIFSNLKRHFQNSVRCTSMA